MSTRLSLALAVGLLFAWSAPWSCQTYQLPDGGSTSTDPNQDAGNGGSFITDASVKTVYLADAGQIGLATGSDGGVTIGQSAAFQSDFVYMSNSSDGTVSRIVMPPDGGAPFEEARYYSVFPLDNHNAEPCFDGGCSGSAAAGTVTNDIWKAAGSDQYTCGGCNSPSRTLIDRNGNVWAALRAPSRQAGVTKIIDVDDNLNQCGSSGVPRCHQRKGLIAGQMFTEGVTLNMSDGGTVALLPAKEIFNGGAKITTTANQIIGPNSAYAKLFTCTDTGHDATGLIDTDPVNYDDCIAYSIPLGDPHPDPSADPTRKTAGTSFGRAAAIAPNCDPGTGQCDVWIGMWNGNSWVRLSYNGNGQSTSVPFDVGPTLALADGGHVETGVFLLGSTATQLNPYGASVDCAGIIWGYTPGALSAVTTVSVNDTVHNVKLPAYQNVSNFAFSNHAIQYGIPKLSPFNPGNQYGISSDTKERIWMAGGYGTPAVTSFDANSLLALMGIYQDGGLPTYAQFTALVNAGSKTYNFGGFTGAPSGNSFSGKTVRGVNVDKNNNVYLGVDLNAWEGNTNSGTGAISFNPDVAGSVPCYLGNNGSVSCDAGSMNWAVLTTQASSAETGTVGTDIDAEGNPWFGDYGGLAVRVNASTGAIMSEVPVGNGVYSYSDFSGYALRYITLNRAVYSQVVPGCGVSPELTQWRSINDTAFVPPGTDLKFDVRITNSLTPAVVTASQDYTVCDSVTNPSTASSCPRNADGSIDLAPFNLPQGADMTIYVTMTPLICAANGGANPLAKPVVYSLTTTQHCSGD